MKNVFRVLVVSGDTSWLELVWNGCRKTLTAFSVFLPLSLTHHTRMHQLVLLRPTWYRCGQSTDGCNKVLKKQHCLLEKKCIFLSKRFYFFVSLFVSFGVKWKRKSFCNPSKHVLRTFKNIKCRPISPFFEKWCQIEKHFVQILRAPRRV